MQAKNPRQFGEVLAPYHLPDRTEAGLDEAGRGCLAGPVFAAAVILPPGFSGLEFALRDSKKMSAKDRETAKEWIVAHCQFAIAWAGPAEIDELNILQASFLAMHRAVDKLKQKPDHLLVDGNRFKAHPLLPHSCFVKGDNRFASIAAASILAKTARDAYMRRLAEDWPGYGWERNFAYPTAEHRKAIARLGSSPHHRRSFKLLPG